MNAIWKALSFVALLLTVVPAVLVFAGSISWRTHAVLMVMGAVLWFATAPLWMEGSRTR